MGVVRVAKLALAVVLMIAGALWALFFGIVLLLGLSLGIDESWTGAGGTVLIAAATLLGVGVVVLGVVLAKTQRVPADELPANDPAATGA